MELMTDGKPLMIKEGAWCHYPDSTQAELGLLPFADQTKGPWVVGIGMGMVMHHATVFCAWSLCGQIMNWTDYSCHRLEGHLHMTLPPEPADLLSGELTTVVMQSNKMMVDMYRMFGLQFMHAEHIHGKYGCEPGYICKSWITLYKHGLGAFLDQEMLPMEIADMQDLQFLHFPKSLMTSWGFDGRTHDQQTQSFFWQKKVNIEAPHNKPMKFSKWYNLATEASFMVNLMGVSLSQLEANHKVLCLCHTITPQGVD